MSVFVRVVVVSVVVFLGGLFVFFVFVDFILGVFFYVLEFRSRFNRIFSFVSG